MIYARGGDPCTIVRLATKEDQPRRKKTPKRQYDTELDAKDLVDGYACIIRFAEDDEYYAVCQFLKADGGWQEIFDRMKELGAAFTLPGAEP